MFRSWFGLGKKKLRSVEERLNGLASLGFGLAPGMTIENTVLPWGRGRIEQDPTLLLVILGGDVEEGENAGTPRCDRLWRLDTECIEGRGAYARIARRMARMIEAEAALTAVSDRVGRREGTAWLEFALDGTPHHLDAHVRGDWVDPAVLTQLAIALERTSGAKQRFVYHQLEGQEVIIACCEAVRVPALKKETGVEWRWVS